jgi:hypothetical protein
MRNGIFMEGLNWRILKSRLSKKKRIVGLNELKLIKSSRAHYIPALPTGQQQKTTVLPQRSLESRTLSPHSLAYVFLLIFLSVLPLK